MPGISILTVVYLRGIVFFLFCVCVAVIPLSKLLNNTGYGYKIYGNTINHLFYMDDVKLFAKNDQQLQGLLIVKQFSDDIRIKFGLDKCAKAIFFREKLLKTKNITQDTKTSRILNSRKVIDIWW